MRIFTPDELNSMSDEERKAVLGGEFGKAFHTSAAEHVAWLFWTEETDRPTEFLGQGSAFILDRGREPFLVTAAHVYRAYLEDQNQHGRLYCQVANCRVKDLGRWLIACGNLHQSPDHSDREPDIATFRLPDGAVDRIGKKPISAQGVWPRPPNIRDNAMLAGFPGQARVEIGKSEFEFGFYSGFTPITSITEHQIACRFDRESMVDVHGTGLPPVGYGLGGISGGPLLIPNYGDRGWSWRLGGVVCQAPDARPPEEVLFESVIAHRAEYILEDGTLAKSL